MDRALDRQEVVELTTLLRTDKHFEHLRRLLVSGGRTADSVALAGLIEGEDNSSFGVFIWPGGTCAVFETAGDGTVLQWVEPALPADWIDAFGAVDVGVTMVRGGELG